MRFVLVTIFVMVLSACSTTIEVAPESLSSARVAVLPEAVPTIDPANERLATAQFNYNRVCAHCHGYGGEGQHPDTVERTINLGYHLVPAHDSTGHTWQHPDQVLFDVIKYGVQAPTNFYPMSAFGGVLSDDEIFAIIDYMRLWWSDEQRAWQAQLTEQFTENNPYWTPDEQDEEP